MKYALKDFKPDKAASAVVDWLKQQLIISGTNGYVLGLSGGVDSAVTLMLLNRAAPGCVIPVFLDGGNSREDREDAEACAAAAGVNLKYMDLAGFRDNIFKAAVEESDDKKSKESAIVRGNLCARLRMSVLYTIGNYHNYLVSGTDNADELFTGYFTKYGDGAVDVLPLAPFVKGEVYALGEYLKVPPSVLQKPPSAGFFPGQTDEEEMGISYEVIDAYLRGETVDGKAEEIIEKLHRQSEHKRNLPVKMPDIKL